MRLRAREGVSAAGVACAAQALNHGDVISHAREQLPILSTSDGDRDAAPLSDVTSSRTCLSSRDLAAPGPRQAYVPILEVCTSSFVWGSSLHGGHDRCDDRDIVNEASRARQRGTKKSVAPDRDHYQAPDDPNCDSRADLMMFHHPGSSDRFASPHPRSAMRLIVCTRSPNVCNIFICVQSARRASGSDAASLHAESYRDLVDTLRDWSPGIALTTD